MKISSENKNQEVSKCVSKTVSLKQVDVLSDC